MKYPPRMKASAQKSLGEYKPLADADLVEMGPPPGDFDPVQNLALEVVGELQKAEHKHAPITGTAPMTRGAGGKGRKP